MTNKKATPTTILTFEQLKFNGIKIKEFVSNIILYEKHYTTYFDKRLKFHGYNVYIIQINNKYVFFDLIILAVIKFKK